jgi:hypothetical protein
LRPNTKGVAQVFAHFSKVALSSGYTDVTPVRSLSDKDVPENVPGGSGKCIIAARFSAPNNTTAVAGASTFVVVNVCPFDVAVVFPKNTQDQMGGVGVRVGAALPLTATVTTTTYSGTDRGGFVLADTIGSLDAPPWERGPLSPHITTSLPEKLPPVSLAFIQLKE